MFIKKAGGNFKENWGILPVANLGMVEENLVFEKGNSGLIRDKVVFGVLVGVWGKIALDIFQIPF